MILFYSLFLAAGIFFLLRATNYSIALIERIGLKLRIPTFLLSTVFLAMATSFPELFVGVISAINRKPLLSLGNIFGANIANLTLILGLSTLVAGGMKIKNKVLFKDVFATCVVAFLPYFLLLDGFLTRLDGLALLIVYIFYNILLVREEKRFLRYRKNQQMKKVEKLFLHLLFGIFALAVSAQAVVFSSEKISQLINFPIVLIGVFLLAFGTTLPEMIVQLKSAEDRDEGVFFGNVFGSVVINSSLILGIVSLICPIEVAESKHFFSSGIFTLIIFALLPLFLRSKNKLERREGLGLLMVYLIFILTGFFLVK